jgi:hypothetical protein
VAWGELHGGKTEKLNDPREIVVPLDTGPAEMLLKAKLASAWLGLNRSKKEAVELALDEKVPFVEYV